MFCIAPVNALLALNPNNISASNDPTFVTYDENGVDTVFRFYGQPAEEYEWHISYSPPLLHCTLDSLKLE